MSRLLEDFLIVLEHLSLYMPSFHYQILNLLHIFDLQLRLEYLDLKFLLLYQMMNPNQISFKLILQSDHPKRMQQQD